MDGCGGSKLLRFETGVFGRVICLKFEFPCYQVHPSISLLLLSTLSPCTPSTLTSPFPLKTEAGSAPRDNPLITYPHNQRLNPDQQVTQTGLRKRYLSVLHVNYGISTLPPIPLRKNRHIRMRRQRIQSRNPSLRLPSPPLRRLARKKRPPAPRFPVRCLHARIHQCSHRRSNLLPAQHERNSRRDGHMTRF